MTNTLAAEVARLRRDVAQIKKGQRIAHGASLENAAFEVRDGAGSLRAVMGQQSDGTTAVTITNGPPPPQPTPPIVASVLGGVTASWDGAFADSAPMPLDWQRVEVHASASAVYDPVPATLQGTIETAQGSTVVIPCTTDVYVRLVARNTSGTAGTASTIVGPFGPTPVVADDILDGIVTELKLADAAVTEAKIAADAVTDEKIIAGAILAGHIAAGAVVTDKLAAEAVTAAKIAALAITTDKLDANAVTTAKLAAGSVDATAIAATAITGKTITGGTITGTTVTGGLLQTATSGQRITLNESNANKVIVYNSSGTAIGELSAAGLLVKGTGGAVLWMDPNAVYPSTRYYNAANTSYATSQVTEPTTGDANLEQFCGKFSGSGYTDMVWRHYLARDQAAIERLRATSPTTVIGGRMALFASQATFGFKNTDDTTQDTTLSIEANKATLNAGRLEVLPVASAFSALYVEAATAHTGNLLRLIRNSVDRFTVDKDGNATASGAVMAGNIRASRTSCPAPGAGGGTTTATVTFSVAMTNTPRVVLTPDTTVDPATVTIRAYADGISTTGFTIRCYRSTNSSTNVGWVAIS
ncbi:H-type lectin domain-containing protein, partial [Streptomyces scabiei]|uniref:H-type lectin domain-containing protein n=1 Tax=Streptomyces scabiei TaxID=1930 RepID=UPI00056681E1